MERTVHAADGVDELRLGHELDALARTARRTDHRWRAAGPPRLSASHLLVALPSAAGCARRFVRAQLRQWQLGELAATAELATSELVTNALASTGAPAPASYGDLYDTALTTIAVRLFAGWKSLIIEVWDSDPAPPPDPGEPEDWEDGWPLGVVASLSPRWGYRSEAGGKVIWCEIAPCPSAPVSTQPDRGARWAQATTATGGRP